LLKIKYDNTAVAARISQPTFAKNHNRFLAMN